MAVQAEKQWANHKIIIIIMLEDIQTAQTCNKSRTGHTILVNYSGLETNLEDFQGTN